MVSRFSRASSVWGSGVSAEPGVTWPCPSLYQLDLCGAEKQIGITVRSQFSLMFSVPSPGSPPCLHNGPVQEHMEKSLNFSVALFHLQDFPVKSLAGLPLTPTKSSIWGWQNLRFSSFIPIKVLHFQPAKTQVHTHAHIHTHTRTHTHTHTRTLTDTKWSLSFLQENCPFHGWPRTLKSTVLWPVWLAEGPQEPRARSLQSPAVLPQNSSRFSRVKAFQFVVCFRSIYSALK